MELDYTHATLEVVFPDGNSESAAKALKAGKWATLPKGAKIRLTRKGSTPAEHQKADEDREAAAKAASRATKT